MKIETLEQAKQFLRDNWQEGAECPCCHQFVKRQKRILYSSMAYILILMYKRHRLVGFDEWINVHKLMRDHKVNVPDYTKFKYWNMLEAKVEKRDDDSNRNGMWRITQEGIDFVKRQSRVPKYFWVYNDKIYGKSPDDVDVSEALGKKFNYSELMDL